MWTARQLLSQSPRSTDYRPCGADPVQSGIYEVALMLGGVERWFHSCCCCWREMHGAEVKLVLPQVSEESGQYKHHLQSLQVVNPTYIQGVCQSH